MITYMLSLDKQYRPRLKRIVPKKKPQWLVSGASPLQPLSRAANSGALTSVGEFHDGRLRTAGQ
jgi:hypothetical protein